MKKTDFKNLSWKWIELMMMMMICIFAFVLFFFFSLYICCPLFFFFVFYVFYIDILCAVTASLSLLCRVARRLSVWCWHSFISLTHCIYFCTICFMWFCGAETTPFLCILFPIFLSLFVVWYWNLLFCFSSGALSVLSHSHQWIQSWLIATQWLMELMCSATMN